ncbi:twin-arginine translocase TatA/TatE family subunit [Desulfolutivibrio sulfoxidireducens]|uniref:twin-arginine translocase TatA/TatE family subunit n=1 Tax=Desulfolutivibrio sulfoxidireducens TaxID=2773299 RepID=UPI00052BF83E|nr:twin-arginine translocase TatA/TatE family subunit [Desulfolutivibrio sulfoxidireducens]KGO32889.1 hypothetical protein JT06_17725 [Desulfobulbus sp. Tol-SR]QLA18224.1 twin-arginine translocase TatA/TatE family subunit [Desulfolutivibrio sulfoxidireducens]
MFGIGASELLIILAIVLVFYGGRRLPEIGAGLGKAIRNFRGAGSEPEEIEIKPGAGAPAKPPKSDAAGAPAKPPKSDAAGGDDQEPPRT